MPSVADVQGKFSSHILFFQAVEYVQAAEDASGIEAGGQLDTTADLSVELFEFEIVIPVDNVFWSCYGVVDAESAFFIFGNSPVKSWM